MNPAVSILIPAFNQDLRLLKECVDSALGQTFRDIEVVVSDNHSTNGTGDFLKGYADARLRVVSPPSFLSMNDNFAFCASHARGEYLSFLSSDDVLFPHAIEVLHRHIESDPDMVFGCGNIHHARRLPTDPNDGKSLIRRARDGQVNGVRFFPREQAKDFFFPWTMASTWMAGDIIRRDAYEQTGGFAKCDLLTTGDVWLTKSLLDYGGFFCVDEPLALFRARALMSREVDRDRRLFDFADMLSGLPSELSQTPSRYRRIRQQLSLIYRLGATPQPSAAALERAAHAFAKLHREDLVRIVDLQRTNSLLLRMPATAMTWINLVRRAFHALRNSIKPTNSA